MGPIYDIFRKYRENSKSVPKFGKVQQKVYDIVIFLKIILNKIKNKK